MQQQHRREVRRRQQYVRRLSVAQASVAVASVLLGLTVSGRAGALSALVGVALAVIPHSLFITRAGILNHRLRASQSAKRLFRAEMGKFGLTVALFIALFIVAPPSNPAFFFSAYVAVVLTHWLAPWLMPKRRSTD